MALTFADTQNMIAFLTKSDAIKGFNQIIDFLNASSIKYALTVNPNIYASVIKQFWSFVLVKRVNDVPRLQALVDKKKKVFANMRMVGKGCSGVETPLFEGMIVSQQFDEGAAEVNVKDVFTAGVAAEGATSAADDEVPAAVNELSIPSPTPHTQS
uniref:Xylulose kinase-1 n=1 Tax=Tanacetum cinerariifolium TaxID=118510 RepID=A0A699JU71_TANCI|nr:hypothetical protein [Tanacetum cinerariifolium]